MRYLFQVLFFLIIGSTLVHAQGRSEADLLRLDSLMFDRADRMGTAFIGKNYTNFSDYTYPSIVAKLGGKDSMAMTIATAMASMEDEGIIMESVSFGQRSDFIENQREIQCILPQELKMKIPGGALTVLSYLIAITADDGLTWHFVDTTDQKLSALQEDVPSLSSELVIPPKEQPVFVPE